MTDYDNTNRGALFVNDRKQKDTHPDWKGTLNVNGVDYWVSGWAKQARSGGEFLSLSIQPKEEQAREPAARPSARPQARSAEPPQRAEPFELDDSIPF